MPTARERVLEVLRNAGRIHGSHVLDLLIEQARGRWAVDSYEAEKLIDELGLVPEDPHKPWPTLSQAAFLGLQRFKRHPGYVAGTKTHYWLRLGGGGG